MAARRRGAPRRETLTVDQEMRADHEPAVEVQGLTRRFGARVVLDGVEFALPRGEIFGLLGPNGAGKSTTLNLLMGFLRPTAGAARICGLDCTRSTREVMALVGHMPEEPSLFENLTGRELVSFVLSMRGIASPDRWRAVGDRVARLGFEAEFDQLVAGYSMGTRKKLALVAALAHDPRVLLLDEPTNGLDPVVAREVRALLEELSATGVTVLLSTHLLDVAERVCHRLGVLGGGRLRALGRPHEVCAQAGAASLEDAFIALTGRA
jgi:ABC-2 type transport system ATP-binding protein